MMTYTYIYIVNMTHTVCAYDQKDNSQSINFLLPLLLISAEKRIVIHCINRQCVFFVV